MPKVGQEEIRSLVQKREIKYISLDTSIFDQKSNRLESLPLLSLEQFSRSDIRFVLPQIVVSEVRSHMIRNQKGDLSDLERVLKKALAHWPKDFPPAEEIIRDMIDDDLSDGNVDLRIEKFLEATACQSVACTSPNVTASVFSRYFSRLAPFSNEKKVEFPDAFALLALEEFARENEAKILVVAADKDWQSYCADSERLIHISSLEDALSKFSEIKEELLRALSGEIEKEKSSTFWLEIDRALELMVDSCEFHFDAWAQTDLEINHYTASLSRWHPAGYMEVIETRGPDSYVIAVAIECAVDIEATAEFSIHDEGEYIHVNTRTVKEEEWIKVYLNVGFVLKRSGDEQEFEVDAVDFDRTSFWVHLGDLEVFEEDWEEM